MIGRGRSTLTWNVATTAILSGAILGFLGLQLWLRPGSPPTVSGAVKTQVTCGEPLTEDDYLSVGAFDPTDLQEDRKARAYYASFLRAMKQAPLLCGAGAVEAYRLTRLDYTGTPVSIAVARRAQDVVVSSAKLEAPTWKQPPGALVAERTSKIAISDWHALVAAANRAQFWALPTYERHPTWDGPGTAWIIEGRRDQVHHSVYRASPPAGPFKDLGLDLMRLAGITETELQANAVGARRR